MSTGPELEPGCYRFDDLAVGDRYRTGGLLVTEAHVVGFAGLAGDFFDLHMDDEAAKALGFPARVAHGLLVLSLVDGLKNRAAVQLMAVASLGWDWRFEAPVFIGDRIEATLEVLELRPSRRPDRGILGLGFRVTNQAGTVVQSGRNALLLQR
ncbi:MAG: acyl dehydratase [Geminicoccaceae bacterium]|nr:MAG: acyl dehydratase [Geminicoccaceae bacterium]